MRTENRSFHAGCERQLLTATSPLQNQPFFAVFQPLHVDISSQSRRFHNPCKSNSSEISELLRLNLFAKKASTNTSKPDRGQYLIALRCARVRGRSPVKLWPSRYPNEEPRISNPPIFMRALHRTQAQRLWNAQPPNHIPFGEKSRATRLHIANLKSPEFAHPSPHASRTPNDEVPGDLPSCKPSFLSIS